MVLIPLALLKMQRGSNGWFGQPQFGFGYYYKARAWSACGLSEVVPRFVVRDAVVQSLDEEGAGCALLPQSRLLQSLQTFAQRAVCMHQLWQSKGMMASSSLGSLFQTTLSSNFRLVIR